MRGERGVKKCLLVCLFFLKLFNGSTLFKKKVKEKSFKCVGGWVEGVGGGLDFFLFCYVFYFLFDKR